MKIFNLKKQEDRNKIFWKNNFLEFHPEFHKANFILEKAGYFDSRPQLNFTLTTLISFIGLLLSPFFGVFFAFIMLSIILFIPWGQCYLKIPYDTGIDECDPPRYGFYFYGEGLNIPDNFVICRGKKTIFLNLPWCLDWVRTSKQKKDGGWITQKSGDRKRGVSIDWYNEEIDSQLFCEKHKYTYNLKDGTVQEVEAEIKVQQMEWRPIWFKWTNLFSKVRTYIDINFSNEVGERSGSWKGGVIGCSYDMLENESPLECLRRMEKERKF